VWKEGQGQVPPEPVTVTISPAETRYLESRAAEREQHRGYSGRPDRWGRGLVPNAVLAGFMGEYAFEKHMRQQPRPLPLTPLDPRPLPRGDGGVDFRLGTLTIQVKTRFRSGDVLLRRRDERGRVLPLRWNLCVCCTWLSASQRHPLLSSEPRLPLFPALAPAPIIPTHRVAIAGWVQRRVLLQHFTLARARRGAHLNLEAGDEVLEPISSLLEHLRNHHEMGVR
jgi:hypothetical protein